MNLYFPKIYSPFIRAVDGPRRNKLIKGEWFSDEIRALKDVPWEWTEKIDGTNIRVIWDGYNITIGGRTNDAQIPATLVQFLTRDLVSEELMEQQFGTTPAVLFGEGFGAGINKGGKYSAEKNFVLFDVAVKDSDHPMGFWWLKKEAVKDVSDKLGINRAPYLGEFTIDDAVAAVEDGLVSAYGDFVAEGMVGRPVGGLLSRSGHRIAVKVKTKDFQE